MKLKYHPFRYLFKEEWRNMVWGKYEAAKLAEGLQPKTLSDYHTSLQGLSDWLGQHRKKANRDVLREYLAYLRTTGVSEFRIRNHWVAMSSFFGWLEKNGIRDNPMINIPAPKVPDVVIEIYTKEEMGQVLGYIRQHSSNAERDNAIFTLYPKTGIREKELLQIKHCDINMSEQTIKIHGKGAKERIVPFDSNCKLALRDYMSHNGSDPLFPVSPRRVWQINKEACEGCGIRPRGIHCYRHSFACYFLLDGGEMGPLKKILGHSSWAMVERYSRWKDQQLAIRAYHQVYK